MGKHCGSFAFASVKLDVEQRSGRHRQDRRAGAKVDQAERQPAKANGGVGRLVSLAKKFGQEVRAPRSLARKAQIHSAILRFRAETALWEFNQQKKYWEEWKKANEGANEEFADILRDIPRVKNRA